MLENKRVWSLFNFSFILHIRHLLIMLYFFFRLTFYVFRQGSGLIGTFHGKVDGRVGVSLKLPQHPSTAREKKERERLF